MLWVNEGISLEGFPEPSLIDSRTFDECEVALGDRFRVDDGEISRERVLDRWWLRREVQIVNSYTSVVSNLFGDGRKLCFAETEKIQLAAFQR